MTELDPNTLFVNSSFVDNRPMVYWAYQGSSGLLTLAEARQRADYVFQAAGIAESEGAIVEGFKAIDQAASRSKPQGFGKARTAEAVGMTAQLLGLIREHRPPLPEEIKVIYGFKTQQPLVELCYYGTKIQESPDTVRHHAVALIQAAEAAESDAFYYWYLQEKIGIKLDEAQVLIQEFATFRQRNCLEDLFMS